MKAKVKGTEPLLAPVLTSRPASVRRDGARVVQRLERREDLGRALDQLDQDAFARERRLRVALGMNEAHAMPARPLADPARGEPHALGFEPRVRGERVAQGKKSLNFTVTLGADDRTLTDEDESKYLGKVREQATTIGGELRG